MPSFLVLSVGLMVVYLAINKVISDIQFKRKYKLPPVIPGWPIVGSLFDLPYPAGMWGVAMAKKYGDIFAQKLGSRYLIYLSRSEDVENLLEKRNTINSRPPRPNLLGIMSGGSRLVMMGYDETWRKHRKIMHALLNSAHFEERFRPYQNIESKQLAYELLQNPGEFNTVLKRYTNSTVMSVVFGRRTRIDDDLIHFIARYAGVLGTHQSNPTANPSDWVDFLWYLPKPLQWWRPFGEKFWRDHVNMFNKEITAVEEKIKNGTAKPCFAKELLENPMAKDWSEKEKPYIFSTMIEAGSDTTRTAIMQIVAAAACYPAWAAKARSLVDEVCGANAERLPTLEDKPRIPYLTAVAKETMRWRPFIQGGTVHTSTEEIEYKGYKFPAGTDFTWNAYAISLNEEEYKDPLVFEPERFMNDDLENYGKGHWNFGAGRRICPGRHVAVSSMWLATAVILYCFDISEDPEHPIDSLNTFWDSPDPQPVRAIIKPRSQAHIDLINRGMQEISGEDY